MKKWSNIQISPQDPEIIKINNFEKTLGELPEKIIQIRELITRFEVCHFKYQQHLRKIIASIKGLDTNEDLTKIGINHIRHGESAWKNDTTGKSLVGQQFLWAIEEWLSDDPKKEISNNANKKPRQQIQKYLGDKSPDKIRLVRLLLARLTWDWKSYEKFLQGDEHKDLKYQICRMDICHYAFPTNLDLLIQGIGEMKPIEKFEGCGSFGIDIKSFIEKEFSILNDMGISLTDNSKSDKDELIKAWLIICLAKTLKEQVHLSGSIVALVN